MKYFRPLIPLNLLTPDQGGFRWASFLSSTTTTTIITMSLNWAMLNPNRSPVPLRNEMTVTTIDSGVDLALTIPDVPPSSSSTGGGFGGVRRLNEVGKIYLTDQRVCTPFSGHDCISMLICLTLGVYLSNWY